MFKDVIVPDIEVHHAIFTGNVRNMPGVFSMEKNKSINEQFGVVAVTMRYAIEKMPADLRSEAIKK